MKTGWDRFKELYDALPPDRQEYCKGYIGWAIAKERERGAHPLSALIEMDPDGAMAIISRRMRVTKMDGTEITDAG